MSENKYNIISDDDVSLLGNSGDFIHFGLNQKCFITKFEYTDKAGEKGSSGEAIDITIKKGEKEIRKRYFPISGSLFNQKGVLVNPGEEGYQELFEKAQNQMTGVIVHLLKSLKVTQQSIEAAFSILPNTFQEWATKLLSLKPSNFSEIPVDVFLQYQWNLKEGQTKTYLELPKNMKDGKFICSSIEGTFKEVIDQSGLHYENEKGEKHLFTRNSSFLETPKAKQQGVVAEEKKNINSETGSTW